MSGGTSESWRTGVDDTEGRDVTGGVVFPEEVYRVKGRRDGSRLGSGVERVDPEYRNNNQLKKHEKETQKLPIVEEVLRKDLSTWESGLIQET